MRKRLQAPVPRRRTVLLVVLLAALSVPIRRTEGPATLVGGGAPPATGTPSGPDTARWRPARVSAEDRSRFDEKVRQLSALGYLRGYRPAPSVEGVTVYDAALAHDGLNLYCSGHAREAGILDMRGNVLHRWTIGDDVFRKVLAAAGIAASDASGETPEALTYWRRVHLYDNGDILAICEGYLLMRLDKDSNVLWFSPLSAHHHMQPTADGGALVLATRLASIPWVNPSRPVYDDWVLTVSRDGEVTKALSLLDAFKRSRFAFLLNGMPREDELFHTNTIQVLDGSLAAVSPVYKKGNLLISVLYLNTIAIVDPGTGEVVWALEGSNGGLWFGMHEPVLLPNANILIFDNNWRSGEASGESRVLEFEPLTRRVVWLYEGDSEHPFFSSTCGTSQRLPNGNTLITESDNGRAFEVTREGRIVWEYVNPHRAGERGDLIATLFHTERLDPGSVKWLKPPSGRSHSPNSQE